MDAAGSERAVLLGSTEAGPMTLLYAASTPSAHPPRARQYLGLAVAATDYPWGLPEDAAERAVSRVVGSFLADDGEAISFFTALRASAGREPDEAGQTVRFFRQSTVWHGGGS